MLRSSPLAVRLRPEERAVLEARARRYSLPYREVIRAKIVLMAAEDVPVAEIARRLDTPREVVWKARRHQEKTASIAWRSPGCSQTSTTSCPGRGARSPHGPRAAHASSLATRGLEHDGVIVARQQVVDVAPQGTVGELAEPPHPRKQLLLPAADARVHAATRRVPHDVVRQHRVDRRHVVRLERREQPSGDLLVGVHAIPPHSTLEGIDHPRIADSSVSRCLFATLP